MSKKLAIEQIEKIFNHKFKIISYFQRDLTKFKILLIVMKNFNEDTKRGKELAANNAKSSTSSESLKCSN